MLLFTGRRTDYLDSGSLKIQYNRNRYYDYYSGRWLTHDPLGYVDGMNLYEYVQSNPTLNLDHSGLRLYEPGEYVADRGLVSVFLGNSYTNKFVTDAQILFHPNKKARSCCDEISFGQIVTTYKHTFLGKENKDWHLDGSFPYKLSTPWIKGRSTRSLPAIAEDMPGYYGVVRLYKLNQDFETCAICLKGCEIGANYGCVTWGHTFTRMTHPLTGSIDYWVRRALDTGTASTSSYSWLSSPPFKPEAVEHLPKPPSSKFHKIVDPMIP